MDRSNSVKAAKIYGTDTKAERVVLLIFNGLMFLIGFTFFLYGSYWLVDSQTSNFANTNFFGSAKRITPDEFEILLN